MIMPGMACGNTWWRIVCQRVAPRLWLTMRKRCGTDKIASSAVVIITGRVKDIIIRKGENIAPFEVEVPLLKHPKIADVTVIGLDTDAGGRGELACAVVVSAADQPITLQEIGECLETEGLSKRKWPEQLEFVDMLPKNATGKVLKRVLKEQFSAAI